MDRLALFFCLLCLFVPLHAVFADEGPVSIKIPAYTAYSEPDPDAVKVSEKSGLTGWSDFKTRIVWGGYLAKTGVLNPAISLRLPDTASETLRLTVGKQERVVQVKGGEPALITVPFGPITISAPGYYRFQLEGVAKEGKAFGEIDALELTGPAAQDARFNLVERRNAASVHLGYPVPADTKIAAFYNEVTVRTDPIWSYYMACGFQRGYFGIQVNSLTERRIIFSVWDSGQEAVNRDKVGAEDRVRLLAKGEGVVAGDFGNEGTGGHSHLIYPWKKGDTYRFLVMAKPEGTNTIYSGYFYFPEKKAWGLIASFRAPKDGGTLRGLYSFNEDFVGANGQLRRLAEFGNQWVRTTDGKWIELTTARFTHDPTGRENRKDYGAGSQGSHFYLSNGGFVADSVHYGDTFQRVPGGSYPADIPAALFP